MGFRQILGPQVSGRDLAAQDPTAPPSLWLPLPQGEGGSEGFAKPVPQPARAGWGILYKL